MSQTSPSFSTSSLAAELWIQIFSYLPVPSLAAVSNVSKAFHAFFSEPQNEIEIWRNACLLHGLVRPSTTDTQGDTQGQDSAVTEPPRREWGRWREWERSISSGPRHGEVKWSDVLDTYSRQSFVGEMKILNGEADWKAFLRRRLEIHRSWSGLLPSSIVRYSSDAAPFASGPSTSYLAMLHSALELLKTVEEDDDWSLKRFTELSSDQLSSPSGVIRQKLDSIGDVLGIDSQADMSSDLNVDLLILQRQWITCLRVMWPVDIADILPTRKCVHRIKVDERNGFVLTTHGDGGLIVTDIATKETLWCLPKNYVREYAHLEYEQGYIVFDRSDGSKEVWRSSSIPPPAAISHDAQPPDRRQRVASAFANRDDDDILRPLVTPDEYPDRPNPVIGGIPCSVWSRTQAHEETSASPFSIMDIARAASWLRDEELPRPSGIFEWVNLDDLHRFLGQDCHNISAKPVSHETHYSPHRLSPSFVPHFIIPVTQDDPTRAYRFVYPHLLAASHVRAYIWDIRTGEQVQVIYAIQSVVTPEGYAVGPVAVPPGSPSVYDSITPPDRACLRADKGKGRDTVQGQDDYDGNFRVFRPFQCGFFDENATFKGNLETEATSQDAPDAATSNGRKPPDPLALRLNAPNPLGPLFYVELAERWVFICGGEGLRVFARGQEFFDHSSVPARLKKNLNCNLEPGQLALRMPTDRIQYARWHASLGKESFREHWGSELVRQQVVWDDEAARKTEERANRVPILRAHMGGTRALKDELENEQGASRRLRLFDEVMAVHVSPDQKHFVALLNSSRLVFVPYFERVIAGETSLWDSAVDIQLGGVKVQSVYLSYGSGESGSGGSAGRISVVTEAGVFIVTPYFIKSPHVTALAPAREVDITVHRLAPSFMSPGRLRDVTCLQMSDTGLWVNWNVPEPPTQPPSGKTPGRSKVRKRKGKEPARRWSSVHSPGGERSWLNQTFPLDSTPPSQFTVPDGQCKWNYTDSVNQKRPLSGIEESAVEDETAFSSALGKQRMTSWGTPLEGTLSLSQGDLMVQTDSEEWEDRMMRRQALSSYEVHQIRFIPV